MTKAAQEIHVPYPDYDGTQPCARMNPELFFPRSSAMPVHPEAKAACARCPFLRPCLAYSLSYLVEGFWGGTTPADRSRLRAEHGIAPKTLAFRVSEPTVGERIADLSRAGLGRGEIADQLGVGLDTVDMHLRRLA